MIGVFDSGMGGVFALRELRSLSKDADICFFTDGENAPYGTKSKSELLPLVRRDIKKLRDAGADKILMACCTASTVFSLLSDEEKEIAIPIIEPTASAAASLGKTKKAAVIATDRTAKEQAFSREMRRLGFSGEITEFGTQSLVSMIESGCADGRLSDGELAKIRSAVLPVIQFKPDILILGCTHFAFLENTLRQMLGGCAVVNSAREGARAALRFAGGGTGKTVYLS